jgi:hypothetical protein
MNTELTLKLDKEVIESARKYAEMQNRSLSEMIESYLQSLVIQEISKDVDEISISPFVKSMSSGVHIPADLDYKTEYSKYLSDKYK